MSESSMFLKLLLRTLQKLKRYPESQVVFALRKKDLILTNIFVLLSVQKHSYWPVPHSGSDKNEIVEAIDVSAVEISKENVCINSGRSTS